MRLRLGGIVALVAAVGASGALGGSSATLAGGAAAKPTLAVAIVGGGSVVSTPAGISCPGKCSASFAAGSRVLLTPRAKAGSRFLRWGGDCKGSGGCRVRVSALSAVAAQFAGGSSSQPKPPSGSAVAAGGYTGRNSQNGNGMSFSVPSGAGSVLSFYIPAVNLVCAGGGGIGDHIEILKATIGADRSFTARATQEGVLNGAKAKFTYSISGRFQGSAPSGAAAADGVYREDIVFPDTGRTCTSNNQTWTATRATQPPPKPSIDPGGYTGRNSQNGNGVSFSVPTGGREVLSFTIPAVNLSCVGGGGLGDRIKIEQVTINADRSFTARASQDGILNGAKAKFTYAVSGYFQGPDTRGAATADGVYREDIVFTDTGRTCTSNDQVWTSARTR